MKRLYLTVEGQTEAAFAMSVFTPHWANFSVLVTSMRGLVSPSASSVNLSSDQFEIASSRCATRSPPIRSVIRSTRFSQIFIRKSLLVASNAS